MRNKIKILSLIIVLLGLYAYIRLNQAGVQPVKIIPATSTSNKIMHTVVATKTASEAEIYSQVHPENSNLEQQVLEIQPQPAAQTLDDIIDNIDADLTDLGIEQQKPPSPIVVQIATANNKKELELFWQDLLTKKNLYKIINKCPHYIVAKDFGQGEILYRLQLGDFFSIASAASICTRLKKYNQNCFVVRSDN